MTISLQELQQQLDDLRETVVQLDSRVRAHESVLPLIARHLGPARSTLLADLDHESKAWNQNFESWRGPLTDRQQWQQSIDGIRAELA